MQNMNCIVPAANRKLLPARKVTFCNSSCNKSEYRHYRNWYKAKLSAFRVRKAKSGCEIPGCKLIVNLSCNRYKAPVSRQSGSIY